MFCHCPPRANKSCLRPKNATVSNRQLEAPKSSRSGRRHSNRVRISYLTAGCNSLMVAILNPREPQLFQGPHFYFCLLFAPFYAHSLPLIWDEITSRSRNEKSFRIFASSLRKSPRGHTEREPRNLSCMHRHIYQYCSCHRY